MTKYKQKCGQLAVQGSLRVSVWIPISLLVKEQDDILWVGEHCIASHNVRFDVDKSSEIFLEVFDVKQRCRLLQIKSQGLRLTVAY